MNSKRYLILLSFFLAALVIIAFVPTYHLSFFCSKPENVCTITRDHLFSQSYKNFELSNLERSSLRKGSRGKRGVYYNIRLHMNGDKELCLAKMNSYSGVYQKEFLEIPAQINAFLLSETAETYNFTFSYADQWTPLLLFCCRFLFIPCLFLAGMFYSRKKIFLWGISFTLFLGLVILGIKLSEGVGDAGLILAALSTVMSFVFMSWIYMPDDKIEEDDEKEFDDTVIKRRRKN